MFVCLSVTTNLCCLKSERHDTQYVRPLGVSLDLKVKFWLKA